MISALPYLTADQYSKALDLALRLQAGEVLEVSKDLFIALVQAASYQHPEIHRLFLRVEDTGRLEQEVKQLRDALEAISTRLGYALDVLGSARGYIESSAYVAEIGRRD